MDTKHPVDLKEIELKDAELKFESVVKAKERTESHTRAEFKFNISFCTHVGLEGSLLLLLAVFMAAVYMYITFLYTKSFTAWHRDFVWVFPTLAGFYIFYVFYSLHVWKVFVKRYIERGIIDKITSTRRNFTVVGD